MMAGGMLRSVADTVKPFDLRTNSSTQQRATGRPARLTNNELLIHTEYVHRRTRRAAVSVVACSATHVASDLEVLQQAAADRSVLPSQVCAAIIQIDKHKLPAGDWAQKLSGDASNGTSWRLIFQTGAKQVQDAVKGGKGSGRYIPFNAVYKWNDKPQLCESGVYLGHIASLNFSGPWKMSERRVDFDFDRIDVKLGPWKFGFNLKARQMDEWLRKETVKSAGPFFLFCHVDDEICVARGRGGGLAMWTHVSPVWEAKAGITQS